ncbi:MAG TPA: efflux RND transporter periplasmic adaptor subunit [Rhodanobacteraceae bacterium]|nr:efflux RND transporter periplasmic adaptor subunit [Rhodanobacteraceae bacterium]
MKRIILAIGGLIVLAAALTGAYWAGTTRNASQKPSSTPSASTQRKVLYWYDPMVPEQHFDHPGLSPMGMQMVPKYADEAGGNEPGVVRIDPRVAENLGIRTTPVHVAMLNETIRVPATVAWDPREAITISARVNETLDRLYVRAPFDTVKKGEPLAEVLAPDWSAAAAEYLALAQVQSKDARSLRAAARQRLYALGLSEADIAGLRAGEPQIVLRAPIDGVVAQLSVKQGEQVPAGAPLITLNALDHVWVEADVPQAQMGSIAADTPVTVTVSALPGEMFKGKVQAVLPEVDPATRTQDVRIELPNPDHKLAPGMFAEVAIHASAGAAHPLVPDGSVIATGEDTRVIVAEGQGHFRAVSVKTGHSANGETEILSGLHGDERVVTSGQFLIDSEASLSGALQRLDAGEGSAPAHSAPVPSEKNKSQSMPMPSGSAGGHQP